MSNRETCSVSVQAPEVLLTYFADSTYSIVDSRQSEHATVLFTRQENATESVLMKRLHEYQDTRYCQETFKQRQDCQCEALRRNRAFSPEVYMGLARIEDYNGAEKTIRIGEILPYPIQSELEPEAEYVLLMHQLPTESSLVSLFESGDSHAWQRHIYILAEHVANIHNQLLSTDSENEQWSTYAQLEEKLLHNFGLLDLVLKTDIPGLNYGYLHERIPRLKETLLELFHQETYRNYFAQRVREQRIRLCHGDLKSPNIWILPYDEGYHGKPEQYVRILDAIDFNPTYCRIDILSDFAMLAIDVQTRTGGRADLANEMIDRYLRLTNQADDASSAVLNFYLVEKAFVGAAISIVYDNLPAFGQQLFTIAVKHLQRLVAQSSLAARSELPVA